MLNCARRGIGFHTLFLRLFFHHAIGFRARRIVLSGVAKGAPITTCISPIIRKGILHRHNNRAHILHPNCIGPGRRFGCRRTIRHLPNRSPSRLGSPTCHHLHVVASGLGRRRRTVIRIRRVRTMGTILCNGCAVRKSRFRGVRISFNESAGGGVARNDNGR